MVKDMIVASQPASQTQRNTVLETPTVEVPLRQPSQMHYSFMNKMRDLHFVGGLKVASGEIVAVNPQSIVHVHLEKWVCMDMSLGQQLFCKFQRTTLNVYLVQAGVGGATAVDTVCAGGTKMEMGDYAKDDRAWIDLSFPDQRFIDVPYEEVKIDLFKHGSNLAYKIWYLHGESETFEHADNESRFHDHQEDIYMDDFDELLINSMTQDSGGNPNACVQDKPNTGTQGENRFRERKEWLLREKLIDFVPTISGISLAESPTFKKAPGGAPVNVGIVRLGGSSAFIGKVLFLSRYTSVDVVRAGGFGARDELGSLLPVAIESTDFEASLRDARDYEEPQGETNSPGKLESEKR
ncbi:hypothetical protein IFM89_000132 [Coptis chinensis]|uniref:Uncharacterized protein n=1 Tax=Coptis chinensis TaxID=261450 RepID=A0A835HX55_9MAGN|nr:hypothetical protein IFM89_000132 [Coptis chinensis]